MTKDDFSAFSSCSRKPSGSSQPPKILRPQTNWENLYFYQKAVVLYQMTYAFCRRFLPAHGDRTVDQMVQAARQTQNEEIAALKAENASLRREIAALKARLRHAGLES